MTAGQRAADPDTGSRLYIHPLTEEPLDSVTAIISGTDAKPWLTGWAGGVSMAWAADNMTLLAQTLKNEGRDAAIKLGKDEAERIRTLKADAGTYVHDVQERLILWAAEPAHGEDVALPVLPGHLEDALYDGEPVTEVVDFMVGGFLQFEATEMTVYNQPLGYAGTLDMILVLKGYALSPGTGPRGTDEVIAKPGSALAICVDTKTGKNPEGTWKEQMAAYRRATECQPAPGQMRPMLDTDCAAVLHLRPEYPGGYLLMLVSATEDEAAWGRFRKAASIYRERQNVRSKPGTSVRPLRPDGTMPGPRLCDLAAEGYGRALAPLRTALGAGAELEDLARFTRADILALPRIGPKLIETISTMLADHGLHLADDPPASTIPADGKAA